jgi:hypothetical protein
MTTNSWLTCKGSAPSDPRIPTQTRRLRLEAGFKHGWCTMPPLELSSHLPPLIFISASLFPSHSLRVYSFHLCPSGLLVLRLFECSIGNICESAVRIIHVIHVISVLYLCSPRPQIIRVITQSSCVEIISPGSQICIEEAGVKMQRCRNGNCPMC